MYEESTLITLESEEMDSYGHDVLDSLLGNEVEGITKEQDDEIMKMKQRQVIIEASIYINNCMRHSVLPSFRPLMIPLLSHYMCLCVCIPSFNLPQ